jgi:hypothetical protein
MLKRLFLCGAILALPLHANEYPCDPANCTVGYFSEAPPDYEPYPGTAYESSFTTTQIVATVVVSAAVIAIIAVALTNTPGGNSHCCH